MQKYLVSTGIVVIPVEAATPARAIAELKRRINQRRHEHHNSVIGMSLVRAHDAGTLNYVVMDEARTALLCGELNGEFQETVTRELADAQRHAIPDNLYYATRPKNFREGDWR